MGGAATATLPGKMAEKNPSKNTRRLQGNLSTIRRFGESDTGDGSPSALDFPHYGKVIDLVNTRFPRQFAYLNLYPNYASVAKTDDVERVKPAWHAYI